MGRARAIGLGLLAFSLSGCLSIAITDPNSPPSSGIGFGEELFRLQGRVDYLYGHVLRNQQKLELQVGDLQRSMQNLEQGRELSALRSDVSILRDDLSQMKATMGSPSVVADRNLRERIDQLYKQISKNQRSLESRISRLEETLLRARSAGELPAITPKVIGYSEEPGVDETGLDKADLQTNQPDGNLKAGDRLNGR